MWLLFETRESNWLDFWLVSAMARWAQQDDGWIEVLDRIGQTPRRLIVDPFPALHPATEPLLTIARRHAERLGLLPLILGVARYGPAVPLEDLHAERFEQYHQPTVRWAALSLELLKTRPGSERASELARVSAEMIREDGQRLGEILELIERYERYDEGTDRYLLSLQHQLRDDEWKEQARIMQALNSSLRRCSSDLVQPAEWKLLALPERLLSLVMHR
jgi:hypothetical protein